MEKSERKYASEIVNDLTRESLTEEKSELRRKLGAVTARLTELREQAEREPGPLTMKVRANSTVYRDDGYIGGYVTWSSLQLRITSDHFLTAYLGALAKEPGGGERTEIYFQGLEQDEGGAQYSTDAAREAFHAVEDEALEIVESLREDVKENNPYKDIPIRVDKYELHDALLRMEILKYCEANDEHFSIEVLEKEKPLY